MLIIEYNEKLWIFLVYLFWNQHSHMLIQRKMLDLQKNLQIANTISGYYILFFEWLLVSEKMISVVGLYNNQ